LKFAGRGGEERVINAVNYFNIREAHFIQKWSVRRIARVFEISRNTVKKYLAESALPQYHRTVSRACPVLGPFIEIIDELIMKDLKKPRKERFIGYTFYKHLRDNYQYTGAEATLRKYFCLRRRELAGVTKVTVPLVHPPNGEAQADWIEDISVMIGGNHTIVQGFCLRTNNSKKPFLKVYHTMEMECWLDGHRSGFEFYGAVPSRITYDNPKVAVIKVLQGRKRTENSLFVSFKGYYGFNTFYCMVETPEEKGGVENSVGYIRRNFFVPMLEGDTIEDINRQLLIACRQEDERIPQRSKETIGTMFEAEEGALHALPQRPFECCQTRHVKIAGKTSTFSFSKNYYSVPVTYIYRTLLLKIFPERLVICKEDEIVAVHQRLHGVEYEYGLDPLHYLLCLKTKPGLLEHGKPFVGWKLPEEFDRYLRALKATYGEKAGREYIKVLLQLQTHSIEEVRNAIFHTLSSGTCHPDAVIGVLKMRAHSSGLDVDSLLDQSSWQHIRVTQPECKNFDVLICSEREEAVA
jgi:transposase